MKDTTFGFIGLGLIGGSIARGIKRACPTARIMAYMRTRAKLEQAKEDGIVDVILDGIGEPLLECDIIFLCTPANPTGAMIRQADLSKILDYCKKHGILLVLDECFVEFLDEERSCGCIREFLDWETGRPEHGGSLFLLRAFTKTYAMAGLRLGYGFCTSRELLERMEENWQPWSGSVPAQEAGYAALSEERIPFLKKMRETVAKERQYLSDGLTKAGFTVFHSDANFLLFKDFKTGQESWLYEYFLERGVLIRSCRNYRLLDRRFYRICVRSHEENREFLEILKDYR